MRRERERERYMGWVGLEERRGEARRRGEEDATCCWREHLLENEDEDGDESNEAKERCRRTGTGCKSKKVVAKITTDGRENR